MVVGSEFWKGLLGSTRGCHSHDLRLIKALERNHLIFGPARVGVE